MKKKKIIIVITLLLLIVAAIPYIKTEYLSYKHGTEFSDLYKQTGMIDDIEYLKVLNYNEDSAKVYYIGKNHHDGNIVYFENQNGQWLLKSWETIWSKNGSADSFSTHFIFNTLSESKNKTLRNYSPIPNGEWVYFCSIKAGDEYKHKSEVIGDTWELKKIYNNSCYCSYCNHSFDVFLSFPS